MPRVTERSGVHPAGIAMIVSGEAAMTNYTPEQDRKAKIAFR